MIKELHECRTYIKKGDFESLAKFHENNAVKFLANGNVSKAKEELKRSENAKKKGNQANE